jgi:thioredoxin family protein
MRDARSALGIGILLIVVAWQSHTSNASEEGEPKAESIRVRGKVVDIADDPVSGASLTVSGWLEAPECITDSEGRFKMELPLARARGAMLLVSGPDGTQGSAGLIWEFNGAAGYSVPKITLAPARVIHVKVEDRQGQPVEGVKTTVAASFKAFAEGETNATGRVSLRVPEGTVLQFILADAGARGVDYVSFRRPGEPVSDPYQLSQDHDDPITLKLSPTRKVVVRAEDQDGKPIAGASVAPWLFRLPKRGKDANLGSLWRKTTNEEGVAIYASIPAETERKITIWVRKEGFVARGRSYFDPKVPESEVVATLLPLVPVSGRVVLSDGSPAAGIDVRVCGQGYGSDGFRDSTVSAEDGTFQMDVNPDQYYLFAAGNKEWASAATARVVRLGQPVDEIELKLQRATRVFGRMTAGADDEAIADAYVQLYLKAAKSYYALPDDERLPNPTDSRRGISPVIVKGTKTDRTGAFEFFTGPGSHYVIGRDVEDRPEFEIVAEEEFEINLRAERALTGNITGRVVLHNNREQGVPEVRLFGYPVKVAGEHLDATTDKEGRFEDRRKRLAQIVGVFNEVNSLGAIVRIEPDEDDVTLVLAPTATLRGTLIDEETGKPAAGREIGAGVRVGEDDGPFYTAFKKRDTTDQEGRFEIAGIVPGQSHDLDVVTDRDSEGNARGWSGVGKAAPTEARVVDLGELILEKPYRPPTLEERIAKAFAGDDVAARLERKLADAELAYQQVLLVVADPKSEPTKQFFAARYDDSSGNREFRRSLADYMILGVPPERLNLVTNHEIVTPPEEGATFAILSAEQGLVVTATFDQVSEDGMLDRSRLREFLTTRRVPLPDARKKYKAALAQAEQEEKRVLVQVSGPGCAPCVLLSRYLDGKSELVAKDYVYLKLDSRMPNGPDLIAELRKEREGGIPWMVILTADGTELISGDSEEGNIGYPSSDLGSAHFENMLRETRQRLTDDEIAQLTSGLRK